MSVGRTHFYYRDGLYYRNLDGEYVIVEPPIGAVVRRIPVDYHAIVINGVTYYTDSGVYYVYTPSGYQVVPAPTYVLETPRPIQTVVPVQAVANTANSTNVKLSNDDTYTVNIPNEKSGGYTEVTLKRTAKGFIGPQGEFYPEFPRLSQLNTMYGK